MRRHSTFNPKENVRAGRCFFEKKELFKDQMSKRQLWVKFWILFFPLNFRTEWACHSFTVIRIVLSCWNWFATVQFQTIASISLQSELMKISFWKSKKNKSTLIFAFFKRKGWAASFFFVFSQSLLIWEKKSTYNGNQVKKETMLWQQSFLT